MRVELDSSYYDRYPEMRGMLRQEAIIGVLDSIAPSMKQLARTIGYSVFFLLASPVVADSVNHGPEPTIQDRAAGEEIRRLLQLETYGMMSPEALRWKELLESDGYEIKNTDYFLDFLKKFGGLIAKLDTHGLMNTSHMIDAMNLYDAHKLNPNPEGYADAYDAFIRPYTNPGIDVFKIIEEETGIAYHELV